MTREFKISGLIKEQESSAEQNVSAVYTSKAFYEKEFALSDRTYTAVFRLSDDLAVSSDGVKMEIEELALKCGLSEKQAGVNMGYVMMTLDPGYEIILACALIAGFVIFISVAVIYNIFQIGMAQNIREYGKIRALGATKKLMRSLVYKEGVFLAAYSIPAGTAVGYAVSKVSYEILVRMGNEISFTNQQQVSIFSLPVLAAAAGSAFITVMMALHRPMKIAGFLSPADALRFMESTGSSNAGLRRGRKKMSVLL